jgi:hypothetical protein
MHVAAKFQWLYLCFQINEISQNMGIAVGILSLRGTEPEIPLGGNLPPP